MNKLEKFPKLALKDNSKLYKICDILIEIQSLNLVVYHAALLYFDSSIGINQIVRKLP